MVNMAKASEDAAPTPPPFGRKKGTDKGKKQDIQGQDR